MNDVTITHLGRHGDGVADGPIYVPRALPGETVTGLIQGTDLTDMRIVTPSDERVKPPCRHFKACGGCQMQHASDDLVANWKEGLIATALSLNGIETQIKPILTSPARSRRRAKLSARRTKSGAIVGFHGRASGSVIDVSECEVLSPALQNAMGFAREAAVIGASRKGEMGLQVTSTMDGLDIAVTGGKPLDPATIQSLSHLAETHHVARLTWDEEQVCQHAAPRHKIGAAHVILPPGAFLQATDHGEDTLQTCVQDALGDAKNVVDVFAGCGTFALHIADRAPVHAVEGDAQMINALQNAANHSALTFPVTSEVRDLFRNPLRPDELAPFDAIVIDPPRAGAEAQIAQIADAQTPVVAHVSCDPGSFARDAATLVNAGYVLEWVQPVDQFRWAAHVELAARFCLPHMLDA